MAGSASDLVWIKVKVKVKLRLSAPSAGIAEIAKVLAVKVLKGA